MRIPLDPRVWPGFFVLLAVAFASALIGKNIYVAIPALLALIGHACFFRDFERTIPPGDSILSPADGKVVEITPVYEGNFLKEDAIRVGIFLSVFNRHVNRSPMAGKVSFLNYVPGQFLNALKKKAAEKNESNSLGVESGERKVLVRQIVGGIARRIFCDVKVGDTIGRGDRFGVICYGSRAECIIPKRAFEASVKIGQNVKAGETILGYWK